MDNQEQILNKMQRETYLEEELKAHERRGDLTGGFMHYRYPPPELIQQNMPCWKFTQTWRPRRGHLLCVGPEGVGKSSLSRNILIRAVWQGCTVAEVPALAFETKLWRGDHIAVVNHLATVGVLMIDDISGVRKWERGLDVLRFVVDVRHEARKDMLVTSNMDESQLHKYFSDAAAGDEAYASSLLARFSPLAVLTLGGKSYRQAMCYATERTET